MAFFARVRGWYARFERPISSLSLIGGFVFDALTLKRVDMFWENFWVAAHLAIVAACIILANALENEGGAEQDPQRAHFWLVNVMQFFFGGLLSTYLVFYYRSGTIAGGWPFLLLLAAAFVANERLKRHYARLAFQIAVLFLSIYAFAIFLVPVLLHHIGKGVFLLSGLASMAVLALFLLILQLSARERFRRGRLALFATIAGIVIAVNGAYYLHLIPPIPLSLKDAGVFQSLTVLGPGHYDAREESQGLAGYFAWSDTVHAAPTTTIYAYSAIFSPTAFQLDIVHEWQHYDGAAKRWVTLARITLPVSGGRDRGWRTFSFKTGVTPGRWRVNVETPDGAVIGTLRFTVVATSSLPQLQARTID